MLSELGLVTEEAQTTLLFMGDNLLNPFPLILYPRLQVLENSVSWCACLLALQKSPDPRRLRAECGMAMSQLSSVQEPQGALFFSYWCSVKA